MGNVFVNSSKSKEEVELDIENINKITNNDLFFKKTQRTLNFELSSSLIKNLFSSNIIYVTVYNERKGLKYLDREFYVNLAKFYRFFNTLMNSLPIFYRDNVVMRSTHTLTDEEQVCPICDDKKVNTMLECFHLFCDDCINTWLLKKTNTCPMCRRDIELKEHEGKKTNKNQWDVVEIDKEEYINDCDVMFKNTFSEFIGSNK